MYSTAQPQFLLYAGRRFIRRISLGDNRETTIPLGSGLQNVIALDYDYAQNCIYWADITLDTIKRSFLNGSGRLKQNCAKLKWGRRSCESARLPELWPRFDSWTWRHMWAEFVVRSRPCSEGFSPSSPVFHPPQKLTIPNSNSTWKQWTRTSLWNFHC